MTPAKKPRKDKSPMRELNPDQLPVTERRAEYLAKEAGLSAKELTGRTVAEVNELLKWRVDPELLLYRRICGRVVKRDPLTGELCPVPGATVHIEDTDCSYLGFFPAEPPFYWLLPLSCHREEIATVMTDACGRFCVYLPYWDIDRILRFRLKRICYPDIYRPRLRDVIELLPDPPIIRFPRPLPDPPPINLINPEAIEHVRAHFGADTADRLADLADSSQFGAPTAEYDELLDVPLPSFSPPLPTSFLERPEQYLKQAAEETGFEVANIGNIDLSRFHGPFIRCRDVVIAEWVPLLDVPDITFRVTQDVDSDGAEEQIYGEGFFDVRWNAGSPLTVTLEANASAICVPFCGPVGDIPCEDEPAISTAGYMPLESTHHNNTTGYGRRVNRPSPTPAGDYLPPPADGFGSATAVSPYAGTLNLHGCHRVGNATHYRLTYVLNGVGSPVPFTGIKWWAPRVVGPPIHVVPDADGWYPILNASTVAHPTWLLPWNTRLYPDGTYEVRLQIGTPSSGVMTVLDTSDPRVFRVDNKKPDVSFLEVRWRYSDVTGPWTDSNSTTLPVTCPAIWRQAKAIRVRVHWSATAPHLRNAQITFSGCGGGNPLLVEPTPAAPDIEAYRHWHINALNNTVTQYNEFEIPAGADPGCYTLRLLARGRAFNPSGFDHGPTHNWLIRQNWSSRWLDRAISVVNI